MKVISMLYKVKKKKLILKYEYDKTSVTSGEKCKIIAVSCYLPDFIKTETKIKTQSNKFYEYQYKGGR